MGNKINYEQISEITNYNVAFIGDMKVGKTSILYNYDSDYMPTIGVEYKVIKYTRDKIIQNIHFYDLSGNVNHENLTNKYFLNMDLYILVFDLTNLTSFYNIYKWYNKCKSCEDNKFSKYLLVGNKCDEISIISKNLINKFCDKYNIKYIETSVTNNINITELFTNISDMLIDKKNDDICCPII